MYERKDIEKLLREAGVSFRCEEHAPVRTVEEARGLGLAGEDAAAKCLFLKESKRQKYCLACVREEKRVPLKALRAALGSRPLSLASEEELRAVLGLERGAVTPLGALNDTERRVTVCVDSDFAGGCIGVHPNTNAATLWLKTDDLVALLRGRGADVRLMAIPDGSGASERP